MKKYVFLTPSLGDMGGAQMYTANKAEFLKAFGWDVAVYYSLPYKQLLIKGLKEYDKNFIPDMQYSTQYLPKRRLEKVLNTICQYIDCYDEIVIESQLVALAGWGELLAKRAGGRHIINFLEEHPHPLTGREARYFEFKLRRREILNASEKSLKRLFGAYYKEEYLQFEHKSGFFCSNVVSDVSFDISSIAHADFNVLTIGRLDKPYIETLVQELKKFSLDNPMHRINIHFVGGSNSGMVEMNIEKELGSIENVSLYMHGFVYPIPSGLVEMADIAVASANSILVTSERGCPTICIDMVDYGGMGIYGYTTTNKFKRTTEPFVRISELLEEVLVKKNIVVNRDKRTTKDSGRSKCQMEESVGYIKRMDEKKEYFDEKEIYSLLERCYCYAKWLIHQYLGLKKEKKG